MKQVQEAGRQGKGGIDKEKEMKRQIYRRENKNIAGFQKFVVCPPTSWMELCCKVNITVYIYSLK